jgi:hypothetical protein
MPEHVKLHLYDLSQGMAAMMSAPLLGKQIDGIWHTGVVVFGREYYFGGGIQCGAPGGTHFGRPLRTIDLGETHIPEDLFETFLIELSPRFTAQTYNLLRWNCNNFSDEIAHFLVGVGIPRHIVDLPNEVMSTPLGQQLMPMLTMMENQMRNMSENGAAGGGNGGGGFGMWEPATSASAPPPAQTATVEEIPGPSAEDAVPRGAAPASAEEATAAPGMSVEAKAAYAAQEAELKEEFKKLVAGGMEAKEAATTAVANVRKKNEREARLKRFDPLAKK